ncbi:hypothetical protein RRG08_066104 [Elysia crispata]|uniref:Uncharacterized protein n=1 Tax=Elysia crispata TaxID=231223 RepID=A0AAE1DH73_9GAST|nr:hypothetical protein RRG08_066104 [Elysia crispata]
MRFTDRSPGGCVSPIDMTTSEIYRQTGHLVVASRLLTCQPLRFTDRSPGGCVSSIDMSTSEIYRQTGHLEVASRLLTCQPLRFTDRSPGGCVSSIDMSTSEIYRQAPGFHYCPAGQRRKGKSVGTFGSFLHKFQRFFKKPRSGQEISRDSTRCPTAPDTVVQT